MTLEKEKVIQEIGDACRTWGFFQIINHPVDLRLLNDTRQMTTEFFDLPKVEKLKVKRSENNSRGFADDELTKQRRDWKEIFDFGGPAEDRPDANSLDGKNQWPTLPVQFRSTMQRYYEANAELARLLMDALSLSLNVDPKFFREAFSHHTSFARLNFYPLLPSSIDPKSSLGISRHTDAGGLTILWQDGPGLEVYSGTKEDKNDGRWVPVNPPSWNAFTINIGDMFHVFTGGVCAAPEHRVIANHDRRRYSLPFFYNPNYDVIVQPLPGVGGSQQYRPFTWGEFRRARFAGDYADLGKETQIEDWEIL
jgi:isopenicillin N synthase-like dioxygenase